MSQKNLYYRTIYRRENLIKTFLLDLFHKFGSYPKLMCEVFIRKNFGERYFSLSSVISLAVVLVFLPLIADRLPSLPSFSSHSYYEAYSEPPSFWARYATWYLFLAGFLFFAYKRYLEVRRNPSVFDFGRFSLYMGDINPRFFQVQLSGKRPTPRTVEIIYEPALFFIAGILLMAVGQKIGNLLIFGSIFYSLSYAAAYKKGDDFVMDLIDEKIMNEETESAFVLDEEGDNSRGVRFYAKKPSASVLRKKVADSFIEDDMPKEVETYAE